MRVQEYKNINYGPYERNTLDAYIVESSKPSPVLIYFHGGGYRSGDKSLFLSIDLMQECLDAGISIVTCNYRFITNDPFPAPMNDGVRAIQFVRFMAKTWGIDPHRIALSGSSAGGHLALWTALKGEMANLDSLDPIERISTKVSAFVGFNTQVSKDQRFYEDIYDGPHIQPNLPLYYNIASIDDLYSPENLRLAVQASAINYMTPDSPPAFMDYDIDLDSEDLCIPVEAPVHDVIHHPMHGYQLKKKYDAFHIPLVLRYKNNPAQPGEMIEFLIKHV